MESYEADRGMCEAGVDVHKGLTMHSTSEPLIACPQDMRCAPFGRPTVQAWYPRKRRAEALKGGRVHKGVGRCSHTLLYPTLINTEYWEQTGVEGNMCKLLPHCQHPPSAPRSGAPHTCWSGVSEGHP